MDRKKEKSPFSLKYLHTALKITHSVLLLIYFFHVVSWNNDIYIMSLNNDGTHTRYVYLGECQKYSDSFSPLHTVVFLL